jgi:Cu(I)/Ag(I) efflux system periplasmic protein CusF
MQKALFIALVLLSTALPGQAQNHDHHTTPPATASTTATTTITTSGLPMVDAEVRRVDTGASKLTLKHADIPNLDMPPMTMVFQVRDPARLGSIKAGDKVRFTADKINGAYTVIDLEVVP